MLTSPSWMLIYAITDRRLRPDLEPRALVASLAASGADLIQIREKDLATAALIPLVRAAVSTGRAEVVVNARPDVALAARACGVHLPANGLPVAAVRARWGDRLRVGVSTHRIEEAVKAERDGADLVIFGPVFATPSKLRYGPPVGMRALERVARTVRIPVFAIGGIDRQRAGELSGVPIAGIALIAALHRATDVSEEVAAIRGAATAHATRQPG